MPRTAETILKNKNEVRGLPLADLTLKLQELGRCVAGIIETHRSMKCIRESGNRPTYVRSIDFQQRCQGHSIWKKFLFLQILQNSLLST